MLVIYSIKVAVLIIVQQLLMERIGNIYSKCNLIEYLTFNSISAALTIKEYHIGIKYT